MSAPFPTVAPALAAALVFAMPVSDRPTTAPAPSASARTIGATVRHVGRSGHTTHLVGRQAWSAGSTVVLDGPVVVDAGGALIIEAGTRIEGQVGTYLVV
jgi:hypothetical protein